MIFLKQDGRLNYNSVFINTSQLLVLNAEHDYQMWADVEGEMVNIGLIDNKKDLLAMNYKEKQNP
ncbi:hypothetical protein [Gelidibacter algens]|uniref:hypothetical protein n=1 Tax=Gelidibacter algens TaxID=49280 RepID=UPI0011B939AA|nr:hypothetical protein [Gelidibacter algens]